MEFVEGVEYSRREDIHALFGGQMQGGISTPKDHPYVFIFTGKSGEQHGYLDGWRDEGVFLYTGEGQTGDMEFLRGNAAIRDHDKLGKELLLFEALGKSKPVRFLGRFACQSWDILRGADTNNKLRDCIQFHLIKLESDVEPILEVGNAPPASSEIERLREKAIAAAVPSQAKQWKNARSAYRARSKAVRDYILARAGGFCELTGKPAPFRTKSGEPYLEVHHTRRLSDDGPDDPRYVAAICPSIHREIHYGQNGKELNRQLVEKLKTTEPHGLD
ncbi:HNH endonuclease signature motif containing protein [Ruegeria sp. AU67]|uniref:HNH endonuclease n=1 Tax=Ruegeria sp. AU67 TaxID=2108530 RepID=UPI000D688831|nr:HNH endonuclease signature motif containing protein [Ruegeria sp. AU67]